MTPSIASILALLLLVGLATSLPSTLIEPPTNKMVHDMMDAIESGMNEPDMEMNDVAGKGRAFWLISVTLTSTSTVIETASTTTTITPTCVDGVFMECTETPTTTMPTTTTTVAAPRRKNKNKNKRNKNKNGSRNTEFLSLVSDIYQDAVVTDEYGVKADISVLFPPQARSASLATSDVEEFYMRNVG